jgi:sulfate adenylyltransferase
MNNLNTPYGGKLVNLMAEINLTEEIKTQIPKLKSLDLKLRQIYDVEMFLNGAFSPLSGFMNRLDYERVCQEMRLTNDILWPIPITLDIEVAFAKSIDKGEKIALRDQEGIVLAILEVSEIWRPDKLLESKLVFGTNDIVHPGVNYLLNETGDYYIGGKLIGLELPKYYDFNELRFSPLRLREQLAKQGWGKVVAFQTRNPMHRAHVELTLSAMKKTGANLLINPVVGTTKPGDIDHYTRVRIYQKLINKYQKGTAMISLLPLAMRMAGPREALWHMIIRKNYGISHLIIGRDHAGPGKNFEGIDFYKPYDAQIIAEKYKTEIGIEIVPFQKISYVPEYNKYFTEDELPKDIKPRNISGSDLRARLEEGRELPKWFTYPEVTKELRRTYRTKNKQGVVIFFTGLSGAGKSTIANALRVRLLEKWNRAITLLDGDIVRKHLSSELGFSKEHRNLNILRIGFVASEIAHHGGIAICASISPYDKIRKEVRNMTNSAGGIFILIYVATSLKICEQRDRKGLYQAARLKKIKQFTGISDPYEIPTDSELTLHTEQNSVNELVDVILGYLNDKGIYKTR